MSLPAPYLDDGDVVLHLGDCVEVMAAMPAESVDAVVCDPPYGLEFMGKEWDRLGAVVEDQAKDTPGWTNGSGEYVEGLSGPFGGQGSRIRYGRDVKQMQEWHQTWATEALRVLKPGGHLLAFGGTRTFHRLTCAIEDAGFEIRDDLLDLHAPPVEAFMASLDDGQRDAFLRLVSGSPLRAWLYGSGFPKSLDAAKAVDRATASPERLAWLNLTPEEAVGVEEPPADPRVGEWTGFGTSLKPAWEPVVVARKPLAGTVAANVLAHGTGALNVDGCRVGYASAADLAATHSQNPGRDDLATTTVYGAGRPQQSVNDAGRWPANVVLDDEAAAQLDAQSGTVGDKAAGFACSGEPVANPQGVTYFADKPKGMPGRLEQGASRFFYTAKASSAERDGATHPTVKPLALMRWLVRLVTPPGGVVLDPFAGSGTTGLACREEGFRCVLIEREAEYAAMAAHRLRQLSLLGGAA